MFLYAILCFQHVSACVVDCVCGDIFIQLCWFAEPFFWRGKTWQSSWCMSDCMVLVVVQQKSSHKAWGPQTKHRKMDMSSIFRPTLHTKKKTSWWMIWENQHWKSSILIKFNFQRLIIRCILVLVNVNYLSAASFWTYTTYPVSKSMFKFISLVSPTKHQHHKRQFAACLCSPWSILICAALGLSKKLVCIPVMISMVSMIVSTYMYTYTSTVKLDRKQWKHLYNTIS